MANTIVPFGASMKLQDLNRPALFVVDMVNGFCKTGAMADKKIMEIVPSISQLCQSIPLDDIWFIADSHKSDDVEFLSFPPHCLDGEWESEIVDELQKYIKHIIKKNTTNAFHSIEQDMKEKILEASKYSDIIITGCCTDICVLQFALTLRTYLNSINVEKRIIVPVNCVETYDVPDMHDALEMNTYALKLMSAAGINVVETIE